MFLSDRRRHLPEFDRRTLLRLGALSAAAAALPTSASSSDACAKLVVGTWGGDYAELLMATAGAAVRAAHSAEIVTDVGGAAPRKARLAAERRRPVGSIDVVCLDTLDMHQMAAQDLLMPLDAAGLRNRDRILPEFARPYAVPQGYSAKVIVYNPDKMPKPKSYRDLWAGAYAGKIGLADLLAVAAIETAAQIAGGDARNYEPGKSKLLELKASGVKLYPSNEAVAAAFAAGDIWATIMWRARGHQWRKSGLPVAISVPDEGATPITFELAAPRNAPNKACATEFLDAIIAPEAQAAFAARMGYSPAIADAPIAKELAAEIDFTAEQRANFFKQDFEYLELNQGQLLDWWTRVFKA